MKSVNEAVKLNFDLKQFKQSKITLEESWLKCNTVIQERFKGYTIEAPVIVAKLSFSPEAGYRRSICFFYSPKLV